MSTISIILPVYNAEKYLSKCIESILSQSYKDLEIVVVNDGSTDTSPHICDSFARLDNRIKVIHKKNGGVSSARNEALKIVTGEYVGFIDSDDWIDIDYFEKLHKNILKFKADISICGYLSEDENGKQYKSTSLQEIIEYDNKEAIATMFEGTVFMGHLWNKLYKVECIKNVTFDNKIHMYEDLLFNLQVMININKAVFAPNFGYHYIRHDDSACKVINNKYSSIIEAYEMMRRDLGSKLPQILSHCNKSEMRMYILTSIRIIEKSVIDEVNFKKSLVAGSRNLLKNTNDKKSLGVKYLSLGLLLNIGFQPFKLGYLLIGKRFLSFVKS